MAFLILQGPKKITNYVMIFGGKNAQLGGKQTGLCGQISAIDKIDKKHLQNVQKNSETKSLTHNLSSPGTCPSKFSAFLTEPKIGIFSLKSHQTFHK